eukprot:scaffold3648_cov149-Amphora_coffeaeformis.AAC.8
MPQYRLFLSIENKVIAACKHQEGFSSLYFQIYLLYPSCQNQLPALRVSGPNNISVDLFLCAKLRGTKVRKVVGPKSEKSMMTAKKEEGEKCCCSGNTRLRVLFQDADTIETLMVLDQINEQLSLEAGQNILLGVVISSALDRVIKFIGYKAEKSSRGTRTMRVGSASGLVGAVAAVSIDAARGRKQHGLYEFQVLNNIK